MAKRRTREEIREEFIGLLDVFFFLVEQKKQFAREEGENNAVDILESTLTDKETALADFDAQRPWSLPGVEPDQNAPRWSASMHLQGMREALNDMLLDVREAIEHEIHTGPTRWSRTPETYFAKTGRDLFKDGGDPIGRIKAILKRGSVRDEEEWRMLNEIVSNVDTKLLTHNQVQKAERLMMEFEASI